MAELLPKMQKTLGSIPDYCMGVLPLVIIKPRRLLLPGPPQWLLGWEDAGPPQWLLGWEDADSREYFLCALGYPPTSLSPPRLHPT